MSKSITNQNETQTENGDMFHEDQEFQETENIDEAEKVSEEVSASAEATEEITVKEIAIKVIESFFRISFIIIPTI